jgi:hypothetical protein
LPPHDQLADADDELGWDRSVHGLMRAAVADPPATVPYDPAADPFLTKR